MASKRDAIPRNLAEIFAVTDQLVAGTRTLPALVLIYASIDILASLQRREREGVRKAFIRWADTYLLPESALKCRGVDLYAARCAILHTLTPNADLTKTGEARRIVYAYGSGDPDKLDLASGRLGYDQIAVHIGQLHEAVKAGAERFLAAVDADSELCQRVETAAGQWLIDISAGSLDMLLERTGGSPAA